MQQKGGHSQCAKPGMNLPSLQSTLRTSIVANGKPCIREDGINAQHGQHEGGALQMGRLPHIIALHGDAKRAASAAQDGEQKEGKDDILVELLLLDARPAVGVEPSPPAQDGAGESHAEYHEGHEERVAPLD